MFEKRAQEEIKNNHGIIWRITLGLEKVVEMGVQGLTCRIFMKYKYLDMINLENARVDLLLSKLFYSWMFHILV